MKKIKPNVDSWEHFERCHPELSVVRLNNDIINVVFPEEAYNKTIILTNGKVYFLEYYLPGKEEAITFSSSDARKSRLYDIISGLTGFYSNLP